MFFEAYAIPSKFVHPTLFGTPNLLQEVPPPMYSTLKVTHCLVVESVLVHQRYFHGDAFPRNTHRVTSERWRPKPLPYSAVSLLAYRKRSTAGVTSNHGAKARRLPSVPPNASFAPPTKSSAQAIPGSEARPKKAARQPPVGQARLPPPHGQTRKGDLVSIDRSVLTFLDRLKILGKRRA